jgi:hypothetical protein
MKAPHGMPELTLTAQAALEHLVLVSALTPDVVLTQLSKLPNLVPM